MQQKTRITHSLDRYIRLNRILCSIIGLWPLSEDSSAIRKACSKLRFAIAYVALCSMFVPAVLRIAREWNDLRVWTGVGSVAGTMGLLLFKMTYVMARRRRIINLYHEFRRLWDNSDAVEDRMCVEGFANYARLLTICFTISGLGTSITFNMATLFISIQQIYSNRNGAYKRRTLPVNGWYGHDYLDPVSFELVFGSQLIGGFACPIGICSLDTILMTMLMHVCGQFTLIRKWFHNIGATFDERLASDKDFLRSVRRRILKCVVRHQHMLRLVNEINGLWTPLVFGQILTSSVEICLRLYCLQYFEAIHVKIMFTVFLVTGIIKMVVWCWPAQVLINESEEVANAAFYGIPWYNLPVTYTREVRFLVVRSQEHCRITGYTFQTISLATLTYVFNTAASYFTLLRQMQ